MNRSTITDRINRLLFAALAVFPLGLSALLIGRRVVVNIGEYLPYLIGFVVAIPLVIYSYLELSKSSAWMKLYKNKNMAAFAICLTLVLLSILFRLFLINEYPAPVVNDAILAVDAAKEWMSGPSFAPTEFISQHWGIYAFVLSFVFKMFGASLIMAKSLSVLAAAVSVASLFYATIIRSGRMLLATVAGFLLAIWPSYAMYVNFLAGDHIFIMFFCLMLLALALAARCYEQKKSNKFLIYLMLAAISIAIGGVFKELSVITVPMLIYIVIWLSFSYKQKSFDRTKAITTAICIVIIAAWFVSLVSDSTVSYYAKGPVNKHKTGYFLATGLNNETGGRYNSEIASRFSDPILKSIESGQISDRTYREVDAVMYKEAATSALNISALPNLFARKVYSVWSNEDEINNWNYDAYTLNKSTPKSYTMNELANRLQVFNIVSNIFMLLVIVLAILGTLSFVSLRSQIGVDALASGVFIFAFACALVLIEVMTRYRTILYPAIVVLAVYGLGFVIRVRKPV